MNRRNLFCGLAGAALAGPTAIFAGRQALASGGIASTGEDGPELIGLPSGAKIISPVTVPVDASAVNSAVADQITKAMQQFKREQLPRLMRAYEANPHRRGPTV